MEEVYKRGKIEETLAGMEFAEVPYTSELKRSLGKKKYFYCPEGQKRRNLWNMQSS